MFDNIAAFILIPHTALSAAQIEMKNAAFAFFQD